MDDDGGGEEERQLIDLRLASPQVKSDELPFNNWFSLLQMNDPTMSVLMKRATTLAGVLTTLMRSLRVFN